MRNIKLTIQYDGTDYHGWAYQPDVKTVCGTIQSALERLCGCDILLSGSSRTDAGVHAMGQIANFTVVCPVPTANFRKALNNLLPDDIVITDVAEVAESFSAISDTESKIYRYTIFTGPIRPVMDIRYCWHRRGPLDTAVMRQAASFLVGEHDFKSFASAADQRQSSIRTVLRCDVTDNPPYWVYIDVQATGFLYNMVRNFVGTLVEVGRGYWQPDKIIEILKAKDRTAAGPIAPASGLCLMEIFYTL